MPVNTLVIYGLRRFSIGVPKPPCRAAKCSPIRKNKIPLPPAFHATSTPLSSAPAPPWPSPPAPPSHRRSAPYLRQAVSRPHLLHADACPLSADTFRKLERRPLVRRLFCRLLPRRHNRRLPLPSTTGMVPCPEHRGVGRYRKVYMPRYAHDVLSIISSLQLQVADVSQK